jgi:hypothetical protein
LPLAQANIQKLKIQMLATSRRIVTILLKHFLKALGQEMPKIFQVNSYNFYLNLCGFDPELKVGSR